MSARILSRYGVLFLATVIAVRTASVSADQPQAMPPTRESFTGSIVAVDARRGTVQMKSFLRKRTFQLGRDCVVVFPDREKGDAGDLRPGQRVAVEYRDAEGVLVASRIEQVPLVYSGTVKSVDPENRTLILRLRGFDKRIAVAEQCVVVLRDERKGTLEDVKPGHRVTVTYEAPSGLPTAYQIAQASAVFAGTLTAIDAVDRIVKVKHLGTIKAFHLADDCAIIANGRPKVELGELRIFDKLTLSYDNIDGVNVVTRIARQEAAADTAAEAK